MNSYYASCFYRIDFAVIPSYVELPWFKFHCLRKFHCLKLQQLKENPVGT